MNDKLNCKAINPAGSPTCHNCGERNALGPSDATAGFPCPCNHEAQKRDGWEYCGNCHFQFYPEDADEKRDRSALNVLEHRTGDHES